MICGCFLTFKLSSEFSELKLLSVVLLCPWISKGRIRYERQPQPCFLYNNAKRTFLETEFFSKLGVLQIKYVK